VASSVPTQERRGVFPGALASAARFLREAEKNVRSKTTGWLILPHNNSAFHSLRTFLYAAGYVERSHASLITAVRHIPLMTPGLPIS